MTSHPPWQQVGRSAAEMYERRLVPAMFAPWAPLTVDLAGVRPGDRVLDVACGTGVVTRLAAIQAEPTGRVVGLDINREMLRVARTLPEEGGAVIEWLEASALEIPFPDAAFDIVLCQQGLQQFADRAAAPREMYRVLAPGGRLAASVWSRIEGSPGMAALVTALEHHVGADAAANRRAPFALGNAAELHDCLVGAGFHDIEIRTLVKSAQFATPEEFIDAQLAATPLSTFGSLTDEVRQDVVKDVRLALNGYVHDGELAVPMSAHLALAHR